MADQKAIPPFEATPVAEIRLSQARLLETFRSTKTKDLEYRRVQLRRLYWGIKDNTELLLAALNKDLRKPAFESLLTEVDWCLQDCLHAIKHLSSWAKDEKYSDVPLQFSLNSARIRKDPIGTVLIIGAYNFPIMLTFGPLVGAIAAGCPAIIKPSEVSPATAMVMEKIARESLDPDAYVVVNGAVPETTELLDLKWDKIFYTGGGTVGTIIATKAAKTLTPVTLELGGKNPAFVTRNANLRLAARRLLWGKVMNAGQVCISHNYVICDRSVLSSFIQELENTHKDFFPEGAKNSPDFARIVNKRHFQRIKQMIDHSTGKIVLGGDTDEDDLYIEPTAVQVDNVTDSVLVEESFGPLFGIIPYTSLKEGIDIMNEVDRTPLALFVFGSKKEETQVLNSCLSGGASMNDSFFHGSVFTLPFGGVGTSGTGSYRGKASYDTFTHRRSLTNTPSWMDKLLAVRYMPYNMKQLRQMQKTNPKPNFDRSGHVVKGGLGYWLKFAMGLGSAEVKGGEPTQETERVSNTRGGEATRTGDIAGPKNAAIGTAKKASQDAEDQQPKDPLSRATTAAGGFPS
ncbi:aldehyde dehydrogenase [Zalerion maritima]|uniref:Beta-apo-4'-carotenal oxygenase n=1 Tax=Zalerion maritima TaxID=339359 RepID=A0AAD5RPA0_9PEZI|nr:aldehyde dehydrogenase [Zalerion maritima]